MILTKVRRFWLLYAIIGILGLSFVWEVPKVSADFKKAVEDVKEIYKKCNQKLELAWVECPVLVKVGEAADGFMESLDDTIEGEEKLGVSVLINDDNLASNSNAYSVWQKIMTYMNTGLIVVLLIIIFSQLTGYGIDNYGIKKMLPKVIVTAIIMNLSFLICQVAVDLANIIGRGVVSITQEFNKEIFPWTDILAAIFGMSVTGIVTGGISTIFLVVFFFIAAISGIITYVTFILSLGILQLLTVSLVAVSPLAIFCRILPNTEKYFKYWWKIFLGCLTFYPIVAGLYAISKIMQSVGSASDSVVMRIITLVMAFIPLYFAPKVLKKTLVGLDGLGVAIAGMAAKTGRTVKKGANVARKSPPGQSLEKNIRAGVARSNIKAYDATRKGNASIKNRIQNFMAGGKSGYLRDQALLNKIKSEDQAAELLGSREDYRGKNDTQLFKMRAEAVARGDYGTVAKMDTYGYSTFGKGWVGMVANDIISLYDDNGKLKNREGGLGYLGAMQKYMGDNSDFAAILKQKDRTAYNTAFAGGLSSDGSVAAYLRHFEDMNKKIDEDDWVTQRGSALKRGYAAGTLTDDQVDTMLSERKLREQLSSGAREALVEIRGYDPGANQTTAASAGTSGASTASDAASAAATAAAAPAASAAATAATAAAAAASVAAAPAPTPVAPQSPAAPNPATSQSSSLDGAYVTINGAVNGGKFNVKDSEVHVPHPPSSANQPTGAPSNGNQQGQK